MSEDAFSLALKFQIQLIVNYSQYAVRHPNLNPKYYKVAAKY